MDKEGSPYPSQKNFHDFIGWRGRKKGSKRKGKQAKREAGEKGSKQKGKQAKRGNECGRPVGAPTKELSDEALTRAE